MDEVDERNKEILKGLMVEVAQEQKSLRPYQFTVHRLEIRPDGKYAIAKAGGYVKVNDETHWAMLKEGQSYRGLVSGDVLVRLEAK